MGENWWWDSQWQRLKALQRTTGKAVIVTEQALRRPGLLTAAAVQHLPSQPGGPGVLCWVGQSSIATLCSTGNRDMNGASSPLIPLEGV